MLYMFNYYNDMYVVKYAELLVQYICITRA
jgi:hypothetical protein